MFEPFTMQTINIDPSHEEYKYIIKYPALFILVYYIKSKPGFYV